MAHSHRPQLRAAKARGGPLDRGVYSGGGVASQQRSQFGATVNGTLKVRHAGQLGPGEQALFDEEQLLRQQEGEVDKVLPELCERPKGDDDLAAFDDADDCVSSEGDKDDGESDGAEDDSSDDEQQELAKELEKIRRERQEQREAQQAATAEDGETASDAASQAAGAPGGLKRRWDADVVFHSQARRDGDQRTKQKRFINDPVRNDFHRSFLKRYMQ